MIRSLCQPYRYWYCLALGLFISLCTNLPLVLADVPIPGLFGTGLNGSGIPLLSGEPDPHYQVAFSADLSAVGPEALVVDSISAPPTWLINSSESQWISPTSSPGSLVSRGRYVYYTTFDMTGLDPGTARIQGKVAVDNSITYLLINGVRNSVPSAGFDQLSSFEAMSGFVPGRNVIVFDTENLSGPFNSKSSGGIRVELTGQAAPMGAPGSAKVVKNIATGLADSLDPLTPGSPDTDYSLTLGSNSILPVVASSERNEAWLVDVASYGSRWIGTPFPQSVGLPGTYKYETRIDLSGFDPASAFIRDLRLSFDDSPTKVFINGSLIWESGVTELPFREFALAGDLGHGLFHDGWNSIRFEVVNQFFSAHPIGLNSTGLRVEGAVVAVPVPETSPIVAVGAALFGLLLHRLGSRACVKPTKP